MYSGNYCQYMTKEGSNGPVVSRRQLAVWGLATLGAAGLAPLVGSDRAAAAAVGLRQIDRQIADLVADEVDRSIRWLWDYSNDDPSSTGYGLVRDRDDNAAVSSVAATGFALAGWCIGVERGVLDRAQVIDRARGSLRALERSVPERGGMLMHFVIPQTGAAARASEYSTIDTSLALCGAIVAARFTADPEIVDTTARLLNRVDWTAYLHPSSRRRYLRMGWSEQDRRYIGTWNMSAEQLCMYLLVAGHPDVPVATSQALYRDFNRPVGRYGGEPLVYEPGGTLFTYQYSHAFFPFQHWRDENGFDWFENSRRAMLANRTWCRENSAGRPALELGLWGSSANDGLAGYTVNGAEPCNGRPRNDGTIPPYALIGALPFVPAEAAQALRVLRDEFPRAWGPYGFCDAVGYRQGRPWYAPSRLGIDKGLTALSGAAALGSTLVWDSFDSHPWVTRGRTVLGFTRA